MPSEPVATAAPCAGEGQECYVHGVKEVRRNLAGHTSWMVYCRRPQEWAEGVDFDPCDPFPRLNRKRAAADAHLHTAETGHRCEVVKVRYESIIWTEPTDA